MVTVQERIAQTESEADTEPTEVQKAECNERRPQRITRYGP